MGILARGETHQALFENSALGMMSLLINLEEVSPGGIREKVKVSAADRESLLVSWLNEVLFLFTVQAMALCQFKILNISSTELTAEVGGELLDAGRHTVLREIKSATYHDLNIQSVGTGYQVRIVFDV